MSTTIRIAAAVAALTGAPAIATEGHPHAAPRTPPEQRAQQEKCGHGVQKSLCTRCNPKLSAVYKAKGDWCAEHERPESQCAPCHPELAKKGVK